MSRIDRYFDSIFSLFLLFVLFFITARVSKVFASNVITNAGWTVNTSPILVPGADGTWDDGRVSASSVINDGGTYKMWYVGQDSTDAVGKIGYATSSDGISWNKYLTPVLDLSSQNIELGKPTVLKINGTYMMWMAMISNGQSWEVGYSTSSDGISWSIPTAVLSSSESWESGGLVVGDVIFLNGEYQMYYGNTGGTISTGYATSSDGINWTKYPNNPIFVPNSDESPEAFATSINFDNGIYTMFYFAGFPTSDILEATSQDGINWVRVDNNPQISPSDIPNAARTVNPSTITQNSLTQMWFSTDINNSTDIFYATFSANETPTPTPSPSPSPTPTPTPTPLPQITNVSPAQIWVGLANSQDKGIKYDFLAQVYKDGNLITSGELDSADSGGAGYSHANLNTILFNAFSPVTYHVGDQLKLTLYVRNACVGSKNNGKTARLWFNDTVANSQFGATLNGVTNPYYLLNNFLLGVNPGSGPQQTIDVDPGAKCSPFKPFGTWTTTL